MIRTVTSSSLWLRISMASFSCIHFRPVSMRKLVCFRSPTMSNALPIRSDRFSSFGVWSIFSSPMNSSALSAGSCL